MTTGNLAREKTVTWPDPAAIARSAHGAVGLEFLRSMVGGDVEQPPIGHLLGMRLVEVDHGRAVFTLEPDDSMYNPIGVVHGGIVCTLLDSALGCALHTTLPAGKGYTSVEIKVSYLRAVTAASGTLTATGTLVKGGSRVAFSEGVVTDESGTPVATATSTCLVFDVPADG